MSKHHAFLKVNQNHIQNLAGEEILLHGVRAGWLDEYGKFHHRFPSK